VIAAFTSLSFDGTDRAGIPPRADAYTRAVCAVLVAKRKRIPKVEEYGTTFLC
jgi:hypothetical protein